MKKVKGQIIFEIEYELKSENYPDGWTEQQMLEIDKQSVEEDVDLFLDGWSKAMGVNLEIVEE